MSPEILYGKGTCWIIKSTYYNNLKKSHCALRLTWWSVFSKFHIVICVWPPADPTFTTFRSCHLSDLTSNCIKCQACHMRAVSVGVISSTLSINDTTTTKTCGCFHETNILKKYFYISPRHVTNLAISRSFRSVIHISLRFVIHKLQISKSGDLKICNVN